MTTDHIFNMTHDEIDIELDRIKSGHLLNKRRWLLIVNIHKDKERVLKNLRSTIEHSTVELLIDNDNAIMSVSKSPFKDIDARWFYVIDGKARSTYYISKDQALLGWLGEKYLGLNSQFAEFAYKMLKGKV